MKDIKTHIVGHFSNEEKTKLKGALISAHDEGFTGPLDPTAVIVLERYPEGGDKVWSAKLYEDSQAYTHMEDAIVELNGYRKGYEPK